MCRRTWRIGGGGPRGAIGPRFRFHTIQREHGGQPLRMAVQGLSWPEDKGEWVPLVAGRPLAESHFEMIADRRWASPGRTGAARARRCTRVVGLTRAWSLRRRRPGFFTVSDALAIQFDMAGEAVRLERAAPAARGEHETSAARSRCSSSAAPARQRASPRWGRRRSAPCWCVSAPGADAAVGRRHARGLAGHLGLSPPRSRRNCCCGMVDKARRQLGLFRVLLIIISTIIMALILYTLTLDKIHDIALLKLIGARNRVIVGLILQQAVLLGALGFGSRTGGP